MVFRTCGCGGRLQPWGWDCPGPWVTAPEGAPVSGTPGGQRAGVCQASHSDVMGAADVAAPSPRHLPSSPEAGHTPPGAGVWAPGWAGSYAPL